MNLDGFEKYYTADEKNDDSGIRKMYKCCICIYTSILSESHLKITKEVK